MILEDIVISRVRVKMLQLFLSNPGQMIHVRAIVRKLGEEINAVRRELAHMEKKGMVSKERRANRLFYTFRKDYLIYYELLELIGKISGLGEEIIKNRSKIGKIKFAMISGRYLRGVKKQSSTDVDLLLVGTVVLPELSQLIKAEETRRDVEFNYTVMTEEEFEFRKRRQDPFVQGILRGSRVMIIGDEEELLV
ncbi:hypothetical protein ACFL1P_00505 [Patescibacteria group bacterium]